jgi:hypothetical protein
MNINRGISVKFSGVVYPAGLEIGDDEYELLFLRFVEILNIYAIVGSKAVLNREKK